MRTILQKILVNWQAALFWFVLGSLISVLITHMMNKESTRLLNLSLRAIESAGLGVQYIYDKNGNIIDLIIKGSINATLPPITASIQGTVGPPTIVKPETQKGQSR
jgi:hypothetical protein